MSEPPERYEGAPPKLPWLCVVERLAKPGDQGNEGLMLTCPCGSHEWVLWRGDETGTLSLKCFKCSLSQEDRTEELPCSSGLSLILKFTAPSTN